ncbi:MAG: hypothetical protein DRN78_00150 [Thermoproteota archaeon]|nr:MAG: hypothetical protein DRN78_00150 [Candidatus Korarchaeota archaeon]
MKIVTPKIITIMNEKGRVALLRNRSYSVGRNVIIEYPKGISWERKKAVVEKVVANPTIDDLSQYVEISGFDSAKAWWLTSVALLKRTPPYLIVLRIREGSMEPTSKRSRGD